VFYYVIRTDYREVALKESTIGGLR